MKGFTFCCFFAVCVLAVTVSGLCPTGWAQRGSFCYNILQTGGNRSEAKQLCGHHSALLLSVKDKDEWSFISSLFQTTDLKHDAWTGLQFVNGQWSWSDSTPYNELYLWQKSDFENQNFVPTPDSNHTKAAISSVGSKIIFKPTTSETKLYAFCKRDISSRDLCDQNGWVSYNGVCHKRYLPATWDDAVASCKDSEAYLLFPRYKEDLLPVNYFFAVNDTIWIDANDRAISGSFVNSDGRSMTYQPWLPGGNNEILNPNKTCVVALNNEPDIGYYTQACREELPYLCQKPEGTCPLGWIQDGLDCYQFHLRPEEKQSWFSAVDYCKQSGAQMITYI